MKEEIKNQLIKPLFCSVENHKKKPLNVSAVIKSPDNRIIKNSSPGRFKSTMRYLT